MSEMNSRQVVVFGTDTPVGSLPYEDSRKSVDFREQELPHELEWALKSGGETQEYLTEMMGPQVHIQNLPQNTFPVASPSTKIRKSSSERSVMLNSNSEQVIQDVNPDIEVLSVDQLENVQVIASRMQKIYPNGKVAVTDFSLAMLEGQITCLLGTKLIYCVYQALNSPVLCSSYLYCKTNELIIISLRCIRS